MNIIINSESRKQQAIAQIQRINARTVHPYSVEILPASKKRTIEQNRLQRKWINEAAEQLKDETPEEKRAYCKLHIGVPIACENAQYAEAYNEIIRPLAYEQKLKLMMIPLDFPVTRVFNTEQTTRYLNQVYNHFAELGVVLTEPPQHPAWVR